jgi:hypothetical protein
MAKISPVTLGIWRKRRARRLTPIPIKNPKFNINDGHVNKVPCVVCGKLKAKIKRKSESSPRHPYFVDIFKRRWSYNTCPDCVEGPPPVKEVTPPKRHCRGCKKVLDSSRYFTHISCASDAEFDEDFLYS